MFDWFSRKEKPRKQKPPKAAPAPAPEVREVVKEVVREVVVPPPLPTPLPRPVVTGSPIERYEAVRRHYGLHTRPKPWMDAYAGNITDEYVDTVIDICDEVQRQVIDAMRRRAVPEELNFHLSATKPDQLRGTFENFVRHRSRVEVRKFAAHHELPFFEDEV